jgi:hypothetical protein
MDQQQQQEQEEEQEQQHLSQLASEGIHPQEQQRQEHQDGSTPETNSTQQTLRHMMHQIKNQLDLTDESLSRWILCSWMFGKIKTELMELNDGDYVAVVCSIFFAFRRHQVRTSSSSNALHKTNPSCNLEY